MKFTLSWLKDHLETTATLDEIVETLTRIGLEVEDVERPGERLAPFVIARVTEAVQHPNADRLRVCKVDAGGPEALQIVCGGPNAHAGLVTVLAPVGATIPTNGAVIAAGTIRGVRSDGMLCSGGELGLDGGDPPGHILDLPADAPVGASYAAWAGLDDPVVHINLTPNRPDATSVRGIARDLAAAGLGRLATPPIDPVPGRFANPVPLRLDFAPEDAHLVPAFALRLVRGVKNGPSPAWLRRRLESIGLRPINVLVDVTNYITFDLGRPLHVFDLAKVHGTVSARRARDGEQIQALNGRTYTLDAAMVVIADDQGAEGIAGIMGGELSGSDEATTDVLIESAIWDAASLAQTGRRLGITSDARYRFERGVDPAVCLPGLELATRMILQLCGGEASTVTLAGEIPKPDIHIDLPLGEVERLTGLVLPPADMLAILGRLGFEPLVTEEGSGTVRVRVPSWRPDVHGKADLVEEIVRIAGLDQVAPTPLPRLEAGVPAPVLTVLQRRTRQAKRVLGGCGLLEAVTWSFVSAEQARLFGGGENTLTLANPIAAELSDMRPSLVPGLLAAAVRNGKRGLADVALFEVGQIFRGAGETDQRVAAAGLRQGTARVTGAGRHWGEKGLPVSVFDAKADALALLTALGVPMGGLQVVPGGPAYLHPGRSGTLQFGPKTVVGHFGELHPGVLDQFDGNAPAVCFEIVLDALPPPKAKPTKTRGKLDLAGLMPVERDFAFVVDRAVPAADILKAVLGADRALIAQASVFDVYEGPGVPAGQKSVAVAATLQPRDRTLTDADLESLGRRIVEDVSRKTGAVLRA